MAIQPLGTKFQLKMHWKLLFTKHNEVFRYKRALNRDEEMFKPLRIDWVIKYLFWNAYISIIMFLIKPFYLLCWKFWRFDEGEEITLSGNQLRMNPINFYKL